MSLYENIENVNIENAIVAESLSGDSADTFLKNSDPAETNSHVPSESLRKFFIEDSDAEDEIIAESLSGDSVDTCLKKNDPAETKSPFTPDSLKDTFIEDSKGKYQNLNRQNNINIGLFGFGCVGQGLYDVLRHSQGLKAEIGKICVKDRNKTRSLDSSNFTFEKNEVLKNDVHNLIVELIDDADAAFEIISRTLLKGKDVVTANKKTIADNFELLYRLQLETGASLLYEGACAGSIPIIRTLEEYYDNELLSGIKGILNGSSNFVLTKMELENLDYNDALRQAQELGFAETNPRLDVAGFDTKYKLCILSAHAFGLILKPDDILNLGIQNISAFDINYAGNNSIAKNSRVKLIAKAEKSGSGYKIFVLPHFISKIDALATVNYEFNGIEVEGVYSDRQFFAGKGAGSHPTGSAVLSDISAITYDYKYGYKKLKKRANGEIPDFSNDKQYVENDFIIKLYIRYEDKKELACLEIIDVEEQYSSADNNYIIANVNFRSLKLLPEDNQLFICAFEEPVV